MKHRCTNPASPIFKHYGGRGIAVCKRWMESFDDFLADMGPKPSPDHSLDRIDNDRGYTPTNCRWATDIEQNRNTRSSRYVTVKKVRMPLEVALAEYGLPRKTFYWRIAAGLSEEDAILRPYQRGKPLVK
jgi:hypothetical protein